MPLSRRHPTLVLDYDMSAASTFEFLDFLALAVLMLYVFEACGIPHEVGALT